MRKMGQVWWWQVEFSSYNRHILSVFSVCFIYFFLFLFHVTIGEIEVVDV